MTSSLILMTLIALISVGTGVFAGILGIGGGVVLVPLLSNLGLSPIEAAATSSATLLLSASYATWTHYQHQKKHPYESLEEGRLEFKVILGIGIPLLVCAYLSSAYGVHYLSPQSLRWGLSITLGLILFLVLRVHFKAQSVSSSQVPSHSTEKEHQNLKASSSNLHSETSFMDHLTMSGLGLIGGLVAGLLGLGGGTLIVPFQLSFLKIPIKTAVKNSKALVALGALSASIGHYLSNSIQFEYVLITGIGMVIGIRLGILILKKISPYRVRILYLMLLSLIFIRSLYMNILS